MTKNDIAAQLCNRISTLTKSTSLNVVEALTGILSDAFTRGENIYLRGFGTLEVKSVKEKKARNISAGTTVIIPAQRTVRFKPCKQLKARINNGTVD